MKKLILLSGFFFAVLLLGGCLTTLHPIFTIKDLIADARLAGSWKKTKDGSTATYRHANAAELKALSPELQSQADKIYVLEDRNAEGNIEVTHYAFMVKLGKYYYMDYYPVGTEEKEAPGNFFTAHYIPMHSIYRIKFNSNNSFDIQQLDAGYLEKLIQNKQVRLRHEVSDNGDYIITASTEELQQYLIKYSDVPEAYNNDNSSTYTRIN